MTPTLPLRLAFTCAVLATPFAGGCRPGEPARTAAARPGQAVALTPAPQRSQAELALRGLDALLGDWADPWLGVLAQLVAFTALVAWLRRGSHRAGGPASERVRGDPGQRLPAGYGGRAPAGAIRWPPALSRPDALVCTGYLPGRPATSRPRAARGLSPWRGSSAHGFRQPWETPLSGSARGPETSLLEGRGKE
jgi:hypothetical protein